MNIREMKAYVKRPHLKVYGDHRLRTTWEKDIHTHPNKDRDGYTIPRTRKQCQSQSKLTCTKGCVYHPKDEKCQPMTTEHRKYCRCLLHVGTQQLKKGKRLHPYAICKESTGVRGPGTNYCYRHYDLANLKRTGTDTRKHRGTKYNQELEWSVLKELHSK